MREGLPRVPLDPPIRYDKRLIWRAGDTLAAPVRALLEIWRELSPRADQALATTTEAAAGPRIIESLSWCLLSTAPQHPLAPSFCGGSRNQRVDFDIENRAKLHTL
jgi:hypothetical protein